QADKRAKAIARVRKTLKRCQADYLQLTVERDKVKKLIAKLPAAKRPDLKVIDSRLEKIKDSENDLVKHIQLLEKIDREENDPEKVKWRSKLASADLLEKDGELGQAIKILEEAPKVFQTKEHKEHLKKLKKLWEIPKEEKEWQEARDFIYKT